MNVLCNRCELLFKKCRPLLGAMCPFATAHEYDFEPDTSVPARPAAAIVAERDTDEAHLVPIQAVDFYEGRP